MSDVVVSSSAIGNALLHACAGAPTPYLVVSEVAGELKIVWANRAFIEVLSAEIVDLEDAPIVNVLRTADGDLPLNALRTAELRVSVFPRVGLTSSWNLMSFPTPGYDHPTWVLALTPATAPVDVDDLLRASEERFRILSERAPIGIFSSEVGLRFGYVNDWFAQLVGVPAEHLLGTGWTSIIDPDDFESVSAGLQDTLNGYAFEGPARLNTSDGEQRWVTFRAVPVHSTNAPASFLGTVEDVTDRRRFEELLSWQAGHDSLTGLPNRSQIIDEIAMSLASGCEDLAVLFIDLDDFKVVNDSLGHAAGDELLIEVASRLRRAVREGDRVYRFAGDEFVVVAHGAHSDREALGIANRLRAIVSVPLMLESEEFEVHCSAGVVRADATSTPDSLLRDADTAMYQAKRSGKGGAALFDANVQGLIAEDLEFSARIREAIANRATSVSYEPVMSLEPVDDGAPVARVVALHASVTLIDSDGAELDAASIMDVARRAKLGRPLIRSTIAQICADLQAWREEGGPVAPDCVSIELSSSDLVVPGLVDHIARCLVRHRLAGTDLAVVLSVDPNEPVSTAVQTVLDQLIDLGVRVSSDEVAMSMSALLRLSGSGLTAISFDPCKVEGGSRLERVMQYLVALADDLGVAVVAENLATPEDVARAIELGIFFARGPAFGPRMIAAAVPALFVEEWGA